MHPLEQRIRDFNGSDFESLALDVFQFQYNNVSVYREFCHKLGRTNPKKLEEIPFLPIEFFKTRNVIVDGMTPEVTFQSSGTGGMRSHHHVASLALYRHTFERIYRSQIGAPENQIILALLPNYIEQGASSLVYMVEHLIALTGSKLSGFYLNNYETLIDRYKEAIKTGKQVILFGVSYALLDLIEFNTSLDKAIIIETGGMKGRRKEMTKAELHAALSVGLDCSSIASEYGMTELLSQGYSLEKGIFQTGITMRLLIREPNDPYNFVGANKTGGINVIDLANLYSCAFIETKDLGKIHPSGFEIMGRFDHSDLRGCNLLVQ